MTIRSTFQRELARCGFIVDGSPVDGLITSETLKSGGANSGRYAFLFDRRRFPLKVDALFRSGGTPTIVFIDATEDDSSEGRLIDWQRLSWNFGLAPILWVSTPDRVLLINSYQPPSGRLRDVLLAEFAHPRPGAPDLLATACGRMTFDTGSFWASEHARRIDRHGRVDSVLLRELGAVERRLRNDGVEPLLAQKLIGRAIFSQYLVDRALMGTDLLVQLFGHSRLSDTLRDPQAAMEMFAWMKATFNGDLFPPDLPNERDLIETTHLATLADFLDGLEISTGQWRLFPFRFDVIPVELISSIYEQFAHSAAGEDSAAQGLHYTPINLVDLTLDQILDDMPGNARVLDPACGSGVFLVEAMRRIVWRRTQTEPNSRALVRDVLKNQIFGVDINPGALQVTAFSLYLAALELDPEIQGGDLSWLRFDHLIGSSLYHASFFATPPQLSALKFDVIVGNPPWTYSKDDSGARKSAPPHNRVAQPRRSPDWAFLWRARELAIPGGRIALLMKATPFFSKDTAAVEARRMMLASFNDVRLINMSQLRGEGLFPAVSGRSDGAGAAKANSGPALLFSGRVGVSASNATVEVANVAWNKHFRRNGLLEVVSDERREVASSTLTSDPVLFKAAMFGNDREYAVMSGIQASQLFTRLGRWCSREGIRMEQGLQLGGGGRSDARQLVGLPFLDAAAYTPLRVSERRLPLFSSDHAHRPRDRAAYEGPLVLCPEAGFARSLERGRYSAAVAQTDIVYTDSFVGISLAGRDCRLADALTLILNSKVTAFMLALGGSNLGIKQPKVEKIDLEALAIPDLSEIDSAILDRCVELRSELSSRSSIQTLRACDELVFDLYGLNGADRRVVDDILTRSRPMFMDTQEDRYASVAPVTTIQLLEYGSELSHWLDTALRETTSYRTVVSRGVRITSDVVALRIDIEDGPLRPLANFQIGAPELFEASLMSALSHEKRAKFRSGRSLRLYSDHTIYIVKLDQRRHWTVSDAQSDLCRLLDDFATKRAMFTLGQGESGGSKQIERLLLH
ncbi:N-6 DNA methylase [Mesorhizobium sp.]|uniref:HsdM family class I SAM-dependent methyltransferase n=1 Tax=Mesorhizobium sp. TaxID=1871066 RepID=UPI000FE6F754|nr:N-6 DNA methylase [Mesorhizobium sp.]RWC53044.1 MAG: hypothetical protein EOS56_31255 [Mesorhizobium sp.]RWC53572.1 MAG: hypothetical protein EOS29_29655 [Mesorhizobium sp.]